MQQTPTQTNPPWQQLPSRLLSLLGDIAHLCFSETENYAVFKRKKKSVSIFTENISNISPLFEKITQIFCLGLL